MHQRQIASLLWVDCDNRLNTRPLQSPWVRCLSWNSCVDFAWSRSSAVVDFGEASASMKDTPQGRARFGVFELDLKAGELHKDGRTVLSRSNPSRYCGCWSSMPATGDPGRDQKKLWPNDTVVEFDHGINTAIQKLRQAFGDSASSRDTSRLWPAEDTGSSCQWRTGFQLRRRPASGAVPSGNDGTAPRWAEPAGLTGKTVSHYRVLE